MKKNNQAISDSIRTSELKIVVIGGGHGLSSILRGLKKISSNITAVVTVADDGGSSGALRRDLGVLPPGDIRNCLTALSDDEEFLSQVLQYRFSSESSVGGHNLGNLLLTALANITGSFEQGIQELTRILAIRGKVTPSTLEDVNLIAEIEVEENGLPEIVKVFGESNISHKNGTIRSLSIEPENVIANPEAIKAILAADIIALGPGSLYTSVIPNLIVKGISQALKAAHGKKIYICNVSTQPGETTNYTSLDHVRAIQRAIPDVDLDGVICNNNHNADKVQNVSWVKIESSMLDNYHVFQLDLVDTNYPWRHDSNKVARALLNAYEELVSAGITKII